MYRKEELFELGVIAMEDRRRSKRLPVNMHLSISDLYAHNHISIQNLDSPIMVTDISEFGIGFISECVLPIDFYFNTTLDLGSTWPVIESVIKIIRCEAIDRNHYSYGCVFCYENNDLSPIIKQFIN